MIVFMENFTLFNSILSLFFKLQVQIASDN